MYVTSDEDSALVIGENRRFYAAVAEGAPEFDAVLEDLAVSFPNLRDVVHQ